MQETLSSNTQNKIILITGATSGIGYALSEIYLKNNWIPNYDIFTYPGWALKDKIQPTSYLEEH